jgi:diacylglycerol O-acyltransferase / wax synthase
MERLSTLDAEFLHLEDDVAHMHIAGLLTFDGPAPDVDDLIGLIEAKSHLIPRYRQRVRSVPFELGRPIWVDDPHYNLRFHIRNTALPGSGDEAALRRLMGRLMSLPLDRDRPLWETWLVEGLPEGRWALITKVHHCMVDGVSGVDLLAALLDISPDGELPAPQPWAPRPEPSGPAKVLDAWGHLAGDVGQLVLRTPEAIRDPVGAARALGSLGQGLLRFGQHLGTTPPLSIEGAIGPHREWARSSVSLDDVKRIRKALGGTVNDVVLAAVANGYRALLLSRGEDADTAEIRTLVPVSVRTEEARGVFDNRVSAILYELPVHLADPIERLESVKGGMAELKGSHMAELGGVLTSLGDLAPPMVVGTMSRVVTRVMHRLPQRSVNTVTTNVPGPQLPLFCLGREMLEYHPYVPLSHGVRVGTAILSYNGNLGFGVTGDFDTAPDVSVLAEGIVTGMDDLLAAAR